MTTIATIATIAMSFVRFIVDWRSPVSDIKICVGGESNSDDSSHDRDASVRSIVVCSHTAIDVYCCSVSPGRPTETGQLPIRPLSTRQLVSIPIPWNASDECAPQKANHKLDLPSSNYDSRPDPNGIPPTIVGRGSDCPLVRELPVDRCFWRIRHHTPEPFQGVVFTRVALPAGRDDVPVVVAESPAPRVVTTPVDLEPGQ